MHPHLNHNILSADSSSSANKNSLPERLSISPEYQWRLSDIYASEDLWHRDYDAVKEHLKTVANYKGCLNAADTLLACLRLKDEISIITAKLYSFARMHRDEDSAISKYQAMTGSAEALMSEGSTATAFIEPELLALPAADLNTLAAHPSLRDYNFYFSDLLRRKQHILSDSEEEIIALATEAVNSTATVFTMLTRADMKFPPTLADDGSEVQLSDGRYYGLLTSANRAVRKQAFEKLLDTYRQYRNTFAATLSGNIKKNIFHARARKYDSALSAALDGNNIPTTVYDNLITTVNNHLSPLHRYIAVKKKALRLTEMHMYDIYASVAGDAAFHIPYQEAVSIVRNALKPLGPDYAEQLAIGLDSGWIDVYENRGKQMGAYSWGVYGIHPFILLNYSNKYNDLSTLAHEMGHAMHSHYSSANQPYIKSRYAIFTAEVASTVNEVLLMDYMSKNTGDIRQQLFLINQELESIRTTVYRQTMFAEFEKTLYAKAENGEGITADLLEELWCELNCRYYCADIAPAKDISIEWARIPHFYRSFYVYQYATGYSAATALAENLLTGEISAREKYSGFLKSGGSDYPLEILRQAGVDMCTPLPIVTTLNKFARLLTVMEELLLKLP